MRANNARQSIRRIVAPVGFALLAAATFCAHPNVSHAQQNVFSYDGPPAVIPEYDLRGLTTSVQVTGLEGLVREVFVSIDGIGPATPDANSNVVGVAHPWVGDLKFDLISPSGTVVRLANRAGGDGSNNGGNIAHVLFSDNSTALFEDTTADQAPFSGDYSPVGALENYFGEEPNGTWQLRVTDVEPLDQGVLYGWSVTVVTRDQGVPNSPPSVAFTTPPATAAVSTADPFVLDGTATDPEDFVGGVVYFVNGEAFGPVQEAAPDFSTWTLEAQLRNGRNEIDVLAFDSQFLESPRIRYVVHAEGTSGEGQGTFDDPYILRVGDAALSDVPLAGFEDWIQVFPTDECAVTKLTLFIEAGGNANIQVIDPRCPPNGPGTFPRVVGGDFRDVATKVLPYVSQDGLDPILVRVFPIRPDTPTTYTLVADGVAFDDSFEPNDTFAEAAFIERTSERIIGNLVLRDDDWFSVETVEGETVTFRTTFPGLAGDVNVQLYDVTDAQPGAFPGELVGFSYGFDDEEIVSYTAQESGRILALRVYGERNSTNMYTLRVARTGGTTPPRSQMVQTMAGAISLYDGDIFAYADEATLELMASAAAGEIIDDGSDQYEPNQGIEQALLNATLDLAETQYFAVLDDEDWFAIPQDACGTLEFELLYDDVAATTTLAMQVFTERCPPNGEGTYPRLVAANYSPRDGRARVVSLDQTEEFYKFLRVFRLEGEGEPIPYRLAIKQGPADDDLEDNDTPATAYQVANEPLGVTGNLRNLVLRDDDFYAFDVIDGAAFTFTINFSGASGDLNLQVFDGTFVGTSLPPLLGFSYGFGDSESVTIDPDPGVTRLIVRVYGERGSTGVYDASYVWNAN